MEESDSSYYNSEDYNFSSEAGGETQEAAQETPQEAEQAPQYVPMEQYQQSQQQIQQMQQSHDQMQGGLKQALGMQAPVDEHTQQTQQALATLKDNGMATKDDMREMMNTMQMEQVAKGSGFPSLGYVERTFNNEMERAQVANDHQKVVQLQSLQNQYGSGQGEAAIKQFKQMLDGSNNTLPQTTTFGHVPGQQAKQNYPVGSQQELSQLQRTDPGKYQAIMSDWFKTDKQPYPN